MARKDLMDRARQLAERGRYTVAPNPMVGAVLLRGDEVIGEGWHARAGGDHAEAAALKATCSDPRGAEMYVTLEPCNHYGRTPPCTDAIIRAGISRVVVGRLDPDPRMSGRSVALLRESGIDVEVLEDPELELQNEQFFTAMKKQRPFVHLKLAATLDGRISASNGDSKWITGEPARSRARSLRAEAGAVLVGAGTVRADDPLLTVRGGEAEPVPVTRVVLDPGLTINPDSRLVQTASESPVVIFTGPQAPAGRVKVLENMGVDVAGAPVVDEELELESVLSELRNRGVRGVLVEGGGETAARFIRRGLVDKLSVFYAPRIIGAEGTPMIGKLRLTRMAEAYGFAVSEVEVVDGDLAVTLYPARAAEEELVYRAG